MRRALQCAASRVHKYSQFCGNSTSQQENARAGWRWDNLRATNWLNNTSMQRSRFAPSRLFAKVSPKIWRRQRSCSFASKTSCPRLCRSCFLLFCAFARSFSGRHKALVYLRASNTNHSIRSSRTLSSPFRRQFTLEKSLRAECLALGAALVATRPEGVARPPPAAAESNAILNCTLNLLAAPCASASEAGRLATSVRSSVREERAAAAARPAKWPRHALCANLPPPPHHVLTREKVCRDVAPRAQRLFAGRRPHLSRATKANSGRKPPIATRQRPPGEPQAPQLLGGELILAELHQPPDCPQRPQTQFWIRLSASGAACRASDWPRRAAKCR